MPGSDMLSLVEKKRSAHSTVTRLIANVKSAITGQSPLTPDQVVKLLQKLVEAREVFNQLHYTISEKLPPESAEIAEITRQADILKISVEVQYNEAQQWLLSQPLAATAEGGGAIAKKTPEPAAPQTPDDEELQKHAHDFERYQEIANNVITTLRDKNKRKSTDISVLQQSMHEQDIRHQDDICSYQAQIDALNEELRSARTTSTPAKSSTSKGNVKFDMSRFTSVIRNVNANGAGADVTRGSDTSDNEAESSVFNALLQQNTDMLKTFMAENRRHQVQYVDHVEIPRTQFKVFTGDALEYWPFVKSYESIIGNSTVKASKKLNALISHCDADVQRVIQSCQLMEPEVGLQRAKALLRAKYGNPFHISQAWLTHMKGYPQLDTPALIQSFASDLTCCQLTLGELGYLSELQNTENLAALAARLPRYLRVKWRKLNRTANAKGAAANLDDMVDMLNNAADESTDPVYNDDRLDEILSKTKLTNSQQTKRYSHTSSNAQIYSRGAGYKSGARGNVNALDELEHADDVKVDIGDGSEALEFDQQIAIMLTEGRKGNCIKCLGDHYTSQCPQYKALEANDKLKFTRDKRLCLLCLSPEHYLHKCKQTWTCQVQGCGYRHHTSLHDAFNLLNHKQKAVNCLDDGEPLPEYVVDVGAGGELNAEIHSISAANIASLPVAAVNVYGSKGMKSTLVLLDSGSTTSLCDATLAKEVGLVAVGSSIINVNTVTGRQRLEGDLVDMGIRGINEEVILPGFELVTIKRLPISPRHVPTKEQLAQWKHLSSVDLPDIKLDRVGILLGQDNAHLLEPLMKLKGENITDPFAIRTPLGWTVHGMRLGDRRAEVNATIMYTDGDLHASNNRLEKLLSDQWRLERTPTTEFISRTDQGVLDRWEKSIHIKDGKFCLDIPFKKEPPNFPRTRNMALACLKSLGRRLEKNQELHKKYNACMLKNISRGYCERVTNAPDPGYELYLTHHAVEHVRKPDVARMVLNGSLAVNGVCLNKMVHQGPDQSNKLIKVLVNFRLYQYAFTGDVEAMYYRVLVPEYQRDALRFLYWKDGNIHGEVEEYRMETHMFGGSWSAGATTFALRKTADVFGAGFDPDVSEAIRKSFYVDDCLKALACLIKLIKLVLDLRAILAMASFNFTKITSNAAELLAVIPEEHRAMGVKELQMGDVNPHVTHTLGSQWHPEKDQFGFKITIKETNDTRRGMASAAAAVYDPMGLCAPFLIQAKRLGQILAKRKLAWDDEIPNDILVQWNRWKQEATALSGLRIDRWLKYSADDQKCQLHYFSDASEMAYGSVCYFVVSDNTDQVIASTILMSRSRLSPQKTQSIPRLELCAAQVSVNLDVAVREYFDISLQDSQFWTDSVLVLRYVAGEPSDFKTFIANRVADIQADSECHQWHYVPTQVNPADMLSRGISATELAASKLWLHGPGFIMEGQTAWPTQPEFLTVQVPEEEIKREKTVCTITANPAARGAVWLALFGRFSSWLKLVRTIAWVNRIVYFMAYEVKYKKYYAGSPLGAKELAEAENRVLRMVQAHELTDVEKRSEIFKKLCPKIIDGLICVGGRLSRSDYPQSFKHPCILPASSNATRLIIQQAHSDVFHAGVDRTLMQTREKVWILGGRNPVRTAIKDCFICKKYKEKPQYQIMADLPPSRVKSGVKPFDTTGVDYMGPMYTKVGRKELKRYIMVATCASTRAVHIEWVVDLTTAAFINGLNRLMARRGKPSKIISDNGTNFVGAQAELSKLKAVCSDSALADYCTARGIEWQFNPPGASHFGGFWERHNRTIRSMLMGVTKGCALSDDAMVTLLCQVEYAINSRPLTRLSDDAESLAPLTPNHFLIQEAGEALAGEYFDRDLLQRRWRQTMRLLEMFWERWTKSYLSALQVRTKWLKEVPNLQVGDLVLIAAECMPRMKWPLAIIQEVFPGKDGRVRTVRVKTQSGTYLRPISKIVLLESTVAKGK